MADSWNKKERENKKKQSKKEKEEKRQGRQDARKDGNNLDSMMAYIDENGNITSTPPDPNKRREVKLEDIQIGVPKFSHEEADHTRTGKVSFINAAKGYGFIKDDRTGESIFVHFKSFNGKLVENDKVSFETEHGPKGAMAVNIKLI